MIGGFASLRYCDANSYYVGNHGEYTQVSELIYHISYAWEILLWIFIPLTPIGVEHAPNLRDFSNEK